MFKVISEAYEVLSDRECAPLAQPGKRTVQWNLSKEDTLNRGHLSNEDTLNRGHLSNEDTVLSPNHIELCTNLPRNWRHLSIQDGPAGSQWCPLERGSTVVVSCRPFAGVRVKPVLWFNSLLLEWCSFCHPMYVAEKRKVYDVYGKDGLVGGGGMGAGASFGPSFQFHFMNPNDLFQQFFGSSFPVFGRCTHIHGHNNY